MKREKEKEEQNEEDFVLHAPRRLDRDAFNLEFWELFLLLKDQETNERRIGKTKASDRAGPAAKAVKKGAGVCANLSNIPFDANP